MGEEESNGQWITVSYVHKWALTDLAGFGADVWAGMEQMEKFGGIKCVLCKGGGWVWLGVGLVLVV